MVPVNQLNANLKNISCPIKTSMSGITVNGIVSHRAKVQHRTEDDTSLIVTRTHIRHEKTIDILPFSFWNAFSPS